MPSAPVESTKPVPVRSVKTSPLTVKFCPVVTVSPPAKVLVPPKVWALVLTKPTFVASAVCRTRLLPLITAPLALLVCESIVPILLTPVSTLTDTHAVPFQMKPCETPVAIEMPPITKLVEPILLINTTRPDVVTVGGGKLNDWPAVV